MSMLTVHHIGILWAWKSSIFHSVTLHRKHTELHWIAAVTVIFVNISQLLKLWIDFQWWCLYHFSRSRSYVVKVEKVLSQTKREVLMPKHHRDSANDYITAEIPKTDVAMRFVVGDSLMYGGYYNAPLETGASYKISIGAVSKVNDTVNGCKWKLL